MVSPSVGSFGLAPAEHKAQLLSSPCHSSVVLNRSYNITLGVSSLTLVSTPSALETGSHDVVMSNSAVPFK